jgi:sigma-B regulation protein RsbU (phosphoserine phosphatase)
VTPVVSAAVPEESADELYEHAPCGYLSTLPDGRITRINATLLGWLGRARDEVVGVLRFADLLTVGGRIYHETHMAPLLRMQGQLGGVALELRTADGARLPVLVSSTVAADAQGAPLRIRTAVFDARDRRTYEQELLRARQEADRERDRARALATALRRSLLPPVLPVVPGLEVAAHYQAASPDEVTGDFYDLFPLSDGRWGVFLGDVCGKGVAAAAVTSLARYALRAASVNDPDPVTVLHTLDAVLKQEHSAGEARFCTVIAGVVTPTGSGWRVALASGGHPPALLLRADGGTTYLDTPGGQLVGMLRDPQFVGTTVELTAGDTLLLFTDGLTEMRVDRERTRYDEEALEEFACGLAPTTAHAAVAAVRGLLDDTGDGLDDDVAVLALSCCPR